MDGPELMPGLPEDLALDCLTRLHYSTHHLSSHVCKRWRHLLRSKDFYAHRKQTGFTHKAACFIQALPALSESKPAGQPRYGISLFDPETLSWDRVDPPPEHAGYGLPLFCQLASTEGKLILMGGMDPSSWEPVRDVFIYEFTTQKWTKGADMPSTRSFFAMGAVDGKVLVAGGHDESKNALNTAWVLDMKGNEWSELSRMREERDECEGVVIGSEFWVVSGYGTETQGEFKSSAEVYDLESGGWRPVKDAWQANRSPRSCVGRNGNSLRCCWGGAGPEAESESESAERVKGCAVDLLGAGRTVVTWSAYQGAPHGFYLKDQNAKFLVKLNVDDDYSGIVQSGCCVEI